MKSDRSLNNLDGEKRPWGEFEILYDCGYCKVKRVMVLPNQRLSLQRHFKRREHWTVVSGEGLVTLNEDEKVLRKGDCVDIPQGTYHRIKNTGVENLIFIEVQTGEYFGEDDIERIEDDYGRVEKSKK